MMRSLRPTVIATLIVSVGILVSCGGGDSAASGDSGSEADVTIVTHDDNTYEPATLKVPSGEVTVEVINEGSLQHTFTSEELGFDTGTLTGGETATVTFTAPEQPTEFVCLVHSTMKGQIVPE